MPRHGLSLYIAHYKANECDFLMRYELKQVRKISFCYYPPKPKEITQAVCYRYLKMKDRLTVGDWNSLIKIVAERVSSHGGSSVIVRSLWINERRKKKIRICKYGFVRTFDKNPRSFDDLYERLRRIKSVTRDEQYGIINRANIELNLLNQSIANLREVLKHGKEHNEINSRIAGYGA